MSYFPFILLSAPEYIVILLLTFSLFRIKLSGFIPHMLFIAFVLGNVSFATRTDPTVSLLSPSIQLIVFIICLRLLFRIPMFYASIITTVTYAGYAFVQVVIFFIYQGIGLVTLNEVEDSSFLGYIVPITSMLLTIILTIVIRTFHLSVDWIPNNPRAKVALNRGNVLFIILVILTLVIHFILLYYRSDIRSIPYLCAAIILVGLLIILIYISKKKDENHD